MSGLVGSIATSVTPVSSLILRDGFQLLAPSVALFSPCSPPVPRSRRHKILRPVVWIDGKPNHPPRRNGWPNRAETQSGERATTSRIRGCGPRRTLPAAAAALRRCRKWNQDCEQTDQGKAAETN